MKKGGSESGEFLRRDVSCCLHLKQSETVSGGSGGRISKSARNQPTEQNSTFRLIYFDLFCGSSSLGRVSGGSGGDVGGSGAGAGAGGIGIT
jgi:hypothetical protein